MGYFDTFGDLVFGPLLGPKLVDFGYPHFDHLGMSDLTYLGTGCPPGSYNPWHTPEILPLPWIGAKGREGISGIPLNTWF